MIQWGVIEKSANCLQKSRDPNRSYDTGAKTSPISDVEWVDEATDDWTAEAAAAEEAMRAK